MLVNACNLHSLCSITGENNLDTRTTEQFSTEPFVAMMGVSIICDQFSASFHVLLKAAEAVPMHQTVGHKYFEVEL